MAASSLSDYTEIVMGQSPPGDTCNATGSGLPLLNGPTDYGTHHPIPAQFTLDARKRARKGDVLFCVRGSTTGRMNWADREYAIGRGVAAIRHRTRPELQPLVRAVIEYGLPGLLAQATGSTFPNVSADQLAGLWWPTLEDDEQNAIARILGTLDDKIELNRRMNETLEAMARALFKSWFVDFDPVRAMAQGRNPGLPKHIAELFPDAFEDSKLAKIPKGWRASSLGEEVSRCGGRIQTGPFGSQLHASDYVTDGIPVVMPKDISQRRVSTLSIARVKLNDAERLSRHRLQEGDIVYSRRGNVERHGLVRSRETGWLCGTGCLLVRLGPKWPSPLFASIALDLPETRAWIVQHAIGATMPNLNTGILARVPIVVPSDEVLHAFNRVAQPLADGVIANDAQSETVASLRDTLLPQLISGNWRVKDAEQITKTA